MKDLRRLFGCVSLLLILLLAGCTEPPVPEVPDTSETEQNLEEQLLPNVYTSEYYKTILPYVSSETRGLVYSYLPNRYDIDEFEMALMRHSQDYYSPDATYFQEGQYLSRDLVRGMLGRKKTKSELEEVLETNPEYIDYGLNPANKSMTKIKGVDVNPVYLAYVLEQNYVIVEDDEQKLQGISIGLALNPYQTYENEAGFPDVIQMDEEALIEKGKELATQVLSIIRQQEGLETVEVMIGLYVLEEESAVIPGDLVAKTKIAANSDKIREWVDVNEKYYLLPSSEVQSFDYETSDQFRKFKELIGDYYPHYYGVIGIAHAVDNQLVSLDITINIEFYSLSEKLSLHQLVSKLIQENFSDHYEINVTIRSSDEIFGVLHRGVGESDITLKLTNWE